MLDKFFLTSNNAMNVIYHSSYDINMVIVSVFIAIFASICSFEMVERLARDDQRNFWLTVGALILGGGVWAMHFIGMLAFRLDCDVAYEPWLTGLSMLPGIFAAGVTLNTVNSPEKTTVPKLLLSGIVMAVGIGLMHFTGMAAIRLDGLLSYDPILFGFSLAVAVFLAIVALLIKTYLSRLPRITLSIIPSVLGGSVLGLAISSMHYIAMGAAHFVHSQPIGEDRVIVATNTTDIAITVTCVAILLISSGIMFTYLGTKLGNVRKHIDAILASTSQGFLMMNPSGMITQCNPAMLSLAGADKGSLLGKCFQELVITSDSLHRQGDYQVEAQLKRNDGSLLPCLIHGNSIINQQGELLSSFALFSDISKRCEAEKALQEREQRFSALLDSTPDPMLIVDSHGLIKLVNHRAENLFGFSKAELIDQPIDRLVAAGFPAFRVEFSDDPMQDVQVNLTSGQRDICVKNREGRDIPVEISLSPIQTPTGILIAAALRDITDRKKAESALEKSEIKFRTLFASTCEAVMLLNEHGFLDCNSATLTLFGCGDQTEFCAKHPSDFSPVQQPSGKDSFVLSKEIINKAFELGSYRFEWILQRFDNGHIFPVEVMLTAMELEGKPVLLATVRDITERKQYEEKILQLAEAKNQLLQSEKMATIGQLAAGVAHEMNNPIAFVHANLGSLESYVKDILEVTAAYQEAAQANLSGNMSSLTAEKNFDYLKSDIFELIAESKEGLSRVKKIVQDLKDFSRVGESEWQFSDLHKGLDSTLNIVWNELKYNCAVVKQYCEDLPQINCIASQLNQVFMNLLVNAGHSIEKAGTITITTRLNPDDKATIQVLISDTGVGIPPENLKQIFNPFFTTKPVGKGTGLGLSVTWGIIAKHHGTIEVSSVVGNGTTFTITLPIEQQNILGLEALPISG